MVLVALLVDVVDELAVLVGHDEGERSEVVDLPVQLLALLYQPSQTVLGADLASLGDVHHLLVRLGPCVVAHRWPKESISVLGTLYFSKEYSTRPRHAHCRPTPQTPFLPGSAAQ